MDIENSGRLHHARTGPARKKKCVDQIRSDSNLACFWYVLFLVGQPGKESLDRVANWLIRLEKKENRSVSIKKKADLLASHGYVRKRNCCTSEWYYFGTST